MHMRMLHLRTAMTCSRYCCSMMFLSRRACSRSASRSATSASSCAGSMRSRGAGCPGPTPPALRQRKRCVSW